jgi:flavin-dependent dehydrogenase
MEEQFDTRTLIFSGHGIIGRLFTLNPWVIAVGDAAVKLDPFGSSGTVTALDSGRRSALAIDGILQGNPTEIDRYSRRSAGLFGSLFDSVEAATRSRVRDGRVASGRDAWKKLLSLVRPHLQRTHARLPPPFSSGRLSLTCTRLY